MALAASLNPCCVLTASPVLGNATLADLAAFKRRGGEVYPFFFLPQAAPSGLSLVLSQETYFPTNWFQASNDTWDNFEPLFSEVQEPPAPAAVPAEPSQEATGSAPEEEQPKEEEVETVFVEDEEEYEDYYIDDYEEDDSAYYDDLDAEIFDEAERWERSHHLYSRKKDKVAFRSKQSDKKEKISKRFVNASRYAAELARRRALQEHYAEQQAAAREARAIAQAKAASLAPSTPAVVKPRKAKPSRSNNRHNNQVVADIGLTLAQITELQSRELTPEDYELLLMLDASLPKKTLSKSLIDTFKTITLTSDSDDMCCVCMCSYAAGDVLKELPCGHRFHSGCIETWLSTASTNCPVDGLSLKND